MKRPAVFLSILFITIIGSTAIVSTAISGICRSFQKKDTEINVKGGQVVKEVNEDAKQVSVKL
jgi:hypothetical protein